MTETTAAPLLEADEVFIPPELRSRVFLTINETCQTLGDIGRTTFYRKIKNGQLNLDIFDMSGKRVCRVDQVCGEAARLPKAKLQPAA